MSLGIPNEDSNTILPNSEPQSSCGHTQPGPSTSLLSMSYILQSPSLSNVIQTSSVSSISDSCDSAMDVTPPSPLTSRSESLSRFSTSLTHKRCSSTPSIPTVCLKETLYNKQAWCSAPDLHNLHASSLTLSLPSTSELSCTLTKSATIWADNCNSSNAESKALCSSDFSQPGPSQPSCTGHIPRVDAKSSVSHSVKYLPRKRHRSFVKGARESLCPVCGVTVRASELESHYKKELHQLSGIPKNSKKSRNYRNSAKRIRYTKDGKKKCVSDSSLAKVKRKKTVKKVKSKRSDRILAKLDKYKEKMVQTFICAFCSASFPLSQEGAHNHLFVCPNHVDQVYKHLYRTNSSNNVEQTCTITGDAGKFSEDEVPVVSPSPSLSPLHSPSVSGIDIIHGGTTTKITNNDDDLPVDVETDDTQTYGDIQYTNHDLIVASDCAEEIPEVNDKDLSEQMNDESKSNSTTDLSIASELKRVSDKVIIESLKKRIKILEAKERNTNAKCLICMDFFSTPLVSINCWHVHCKECWLKTMVVKSLCPQCNLIVLPKDLRRIYL